MYARNVTMHLKANTAPEFTRTLETDVLPVLRKQNGFKDEITFLAADRAEAVAIGSWDRRENADNYSRDTYPEVLKSLAKVVEGTPKVEGYGAHHRAHRDHGPHRHTYRHARMSHHPAPSAWRMRSRRGSAALSGGGRLGYASAAGRGAAAMIRLSHPDTV